MAFGQEQQSTPPWNGQFKSKTIQQKLRDASHDDDISVWACQNLMSEAADSIDGYEDDIGILKAKVDRLEVYAREQFCDCYDEYGAYKSNQCDRCKALGYTWPVQEANAEPCRMRKESV